MIEHPALRAVHEFARFVSAAQDLRSRFEELATRAAAATGAASCCLMLLAEDEGSGPRLKPWARSADSSLVLSDEGASEAIARQVMASRAPLLVRDVEASEFASLLGEHGNAKVSLLSVPMEAGEHVIGVMHLATRAGAPPFEASDVHVAQIVATLIANAVQVQRLHTLIQSRVAQATLAREQKQVVEKLTDGTVPPARIAKLLAKSFFRDLSSAGFEPAQIIEAASEIIALVSSDITRFKKRIERGS